MAPMPCRCAHHGAHRATQRAPLKGHSFPRLRVPTTALAPPAQMSGRSLVPPEEKLLTQMLEAVAQRLAPPVLVQQSSTLYSRMGPLAMFERWGHWALQSAQDGATPTLNGSATPSDAPRTTATALTSRVEGAAVGAVAAVAGALAAASGAIAAAAARVVEKASFDLHDETQRSALRSVPTSARSPAALGTSAHHGALGTSARHGALDTSARSTSRRRGEHSASRRRGEHSTLRLAASASKAPFDGVTSALSSCFLNGPWAYSPEADNLRWALRCADRDADLIACMLIAS